MKPERKTLHGYAKDAGVARDGTGATDLIRLYKLNSSSQWPIDDIDRTVLSALNYIMGLDGQFTSIYVQETDHPGQESTWEVYLEQACGIRSPLSRSGSGLRTILLTLIKLHIEPKLLGIGANRAVYIFEELENNLHPALQRRLIDYILDHVEKSESYLFLTSHSNVILDAVTRRRSSQILLVTRTDGVSSCRTISSISDKIETLYELGSRPSDLLQANGIIWLEGPSDRIYFNRWIELISEGNLVEGRDYQCAFYGGALLARHSADVALEDQEKFVDLLKINTNLVIICDSDRQSLENPLKERVTQIQDALREFSSSLVWVLDAREVENYLTPAALTNLNSERKQGGTDPLPELGQYENFWTRTGAEGYLKRNIGIASEDKVKLATQLAPQLTLDDLRNKFDWFKKMTAIKHLIERWNQ